jgi:pyruvate-formate lyase
MHALYLHPLKTPSLARGGRCGRPAARSVLGNLRMVEAGRKATGFEDDPRVHEVFTKYRKTHNESVFDADTPEIINCRRSGISSDAEPSTADAQTQP